MKRNLPRLLTLMLSIELIVAPVGPAFAQEPKKEKKEKKDTATTINNIFDQTSGLLNKTGIIPGMAGGSMGGGMPGASGPYGSDLQMFGLQKQPVQDTEVFNSQLLKSKIPGLAEYMLSHPANLDCAALKPLNIVEPDICEPSGAGIPLTPQSANAYYIGQAKEFKVHFKDIKNLYSDSSKEFQGAKACMNAATNVLDNFFTYRLNELDKLSNELKRMSAEFMKGSEGERAEIAVQTSLLDGSDAELTKDVDSKLLAQSMKDMKADYDRSACPSIQGFKSDQLAKKGLKSTYETLEKDLSTKVGPGSFSGSSYTANHSDVVKDLTDMANNSSKLFKESFGSDGTAKGGMSSFLSSLPTQVASKNGANSLLVAGSFTDLIASYNADLLPLSKKQDELYTELGAKAGDPAVKSLTDMNATNFDSQLKTMENNLKYECLARALSTKESSLANIKAKSYDPKKTKAANAASSNIFDSKLATILNNPTTTPEEKLALLKAAKKDERRIVRQNSWYTVTALDASGNKVEKTVAKGNVTASDYYADVITNCDAQFKTNRLKSSMTGQSAIATLKTLRTNYKKLMDKQAAALQNQIKKKFIECESNKVANSSDAESCSPARFDTSKAGFCANAALSCSTNMQSCTRKTQQQVEKIETVRTQKVANYNTQVKAHVTALKNLYDKTQKLYENQAKWMQGGFVALGEVGFSLPLGIENDPKTEKIASFAEHGVMLDDPAKAIEVFQKNIALLKQEVDTFQGKLVKGMKDYANKKVALYQSVAEAADEMERNCTQAMAANGQLQKSQNDELGKMLSEFGEKLPSFCKKFGVAQENPGAACKEDVSDLVKTAFKASQKLGALGARESIAEFEYICDGYANNSSGTSLSSPTLDRAWEICEGSKQTEGQNEGCTKLRACSNLKTITNKVTGEESSSYVTNCSDSQLAAIAKGIVGGQNSSGSQRFAASTPPAYCEADEDGNYRYNEKYFIPGALGQQNGGAIATGM